MMTGPGKGQLFVYASGLCTSMRRPYARALRSPHLRTMVLFFCCSYLLGSAARICQMSHRPGPYRSGVRLTISARSSVAQ